MSSVLFVKFQYLILNFIKILQCLITQLLVFIHYGIVLDFNLLHSSRCSKCRLENVKVLNNGIEWSYSENVYWKHDVKRFEALKVILHGNAEFEAVDVTLQVRSTWKHNFLKNMHAFRQINWEKLAVRL